MNIRMEVIPKSHKEINGTLFCIGKIIMDDFCDVFTMSLNHWSLEDYKKQWKDGIERIKTYDTSCLVASVKNQKTSYLAIHWWLFYKDRNKIFVHQNIFPGNNHKKRIGKNIFSPGICYLFIPPRKTIISSENELPKWYGEKIYEKVCKKEIVRIIRDRDGRKGAFWKVFGKYSD